MTTESQQQIAREAAMKSATQLLSEDQWHDQSVAGVADELEPIILSSIERATMCQNCQMIPCQCGTIRGPQRSEPTTEDAAVHPTQRAVFITGFAKAIEHGDKQHRQWLQDAAEQYIEHGTVPPKPCPCEPQSSESPFGLDQEHGLNIQRSEQWKQSVEDRLGRIERRLQNVPHY